MGYPPANGAKFVCGIAGFWQIDGKGDYALEIVADAMAQSMRRRGPDAQNHWVDSKAGLGFSHARLSVIDLSAAGAQPMISASGRFAIVYNGEIYNAAEIKSALMKSMGAQCPKFIGHSDTEIILEACAFWGVEKTVVRMIGMFALALWDREEKKLTLVRDRIGIKPLYWGQLNGAFVFGSELKALRCHPHWRDEVNADALSSYMRFNYVPAPLSIITDIHKLEPGHILEIGSDGASNISSYWSLSEIAVAGQADMFDGEDEALGALETLLKDAVGSRMVSDVPLGAFLSGGIDSSLVVALMQAQSDTPIKTFSIGMQNEAYDEAPYARAIASHLGTDHTELYVSPDDALNIIPELPDFYDEPFGDSSQIPTFLVSQLARKQVTVSLSGDGGDEMFTGYNRYLWGDRVNRQRQRWPFALRQLASRVMGGVSADNWDVLERLLPGKLRVPQLGLKAQKFTRSLAAQSETELFRHLVSVWDNPDDLVQGGMERHNCLWDDGGNGRHYPFMEHMQVLDGQTYLPDDILTKLDRASMAASLEGRVPLLDHRVVEFAFRLPRHMRVRDGQGKWALRQVLGRYVPSEMFERPKMGFGIPIGEWLKHELRDWCEELLQPERLEAYGFSNTDAIREEWTNHLSGARNNEVRLWTLLMYQSWRKNWLEQ